MESLEETVWSSLNRRYILSHSSSRRSIPWREDSYVYRIDRMAIAECDSGTERSNALFARLRCAH
ncbi:hypothetical protein MASR2M17_20800 [Aminivibrio sp.]